MEIHAVPFFRRTVAVVEVRQRRSAPAGLQRPVVQNLLLLKRARVSRNRSGFKTAGRGVVTVNAPHLHLPDPVVQQPQLQFRTLFRHPEHHRQACPFRRNGEIFRRSESLHHAAVRPQRNRLQPVDALPQRRRNPHFRRIRDHLARFDRQRFGVRQIAARPVRCEHMADHPVFDPRIPAARPLREIPPPLNRRR